MSGKIQSAVQSRNAAVSNSAGTRSVTAMMNSLLDSEGYRKRFDELLGKRAHIRLYAVLYKQIYFLFYLCP